MSVSMRHVAQLAGVSQRTVSNVVNDYVHVHPETRRKVQEAITTLKYRPNITAQKLRRGRTGLLALALPEIAAPYFAELADHIQQQAARRGITVLIDQTGGNRERELLVLDGYHSNLMDGLIMSPMAITAADLTAQEVDFPVVLLGELIEDSGFLHVSIDNVAAAAEVTGHLIGLDRRRIATIGAPSARSVGPGPARMTGYTRAMRTHGLTVDARLALRVGKWSRSEGYSVARSLVESGSNVDALFCFNDSLALGALKALLDLGVRVPDDVAVVGWDDIEESAFSTPGLTTVSPDKSTIAQVAVDGLLALISGNTTEQFEVSSPYELVVRGSSVRQADPH